jgi:hypothetical protein
MGLPCRLAIVAILAAAIPAAAEGGGVEVHGVVDVRGVRTDRTKGWLDGGLGKTRYGPPVLDRPAALLRLSQLSLLVEAPVGETVSAHVHLNGEADGDRDGNRSRVDVIQGFADVRLEPSARVRVRARLGVFFPPVSQEADEIAWTGPYTITPSAATSWIAEELRTIGVEGRLAFRPEEHELALAVAAFGGNDPTGTLLAWRGWALGDRQTGLSERPALAPIPSIEPGGAFEPSPRWVQPFREIDGRVGYYAAASYKKTGLLDVRGIYYDNQADETAFDQLQYAWDTRFVSGAARVQWKAVELLGQYLKGSTRMGRGASGRAKVDNDFCALFVMASLSSGRHRLSARFDDFSVTDRDELLAADPNDEDGRAWTAAYSFKTGDAHRLAVEVVHVDSDRPVRAALGLPVVEKETQAQASFRLRF